MKVTCRRCGFILAVGSLDGHGRCDSCALIVEVQQNERPADQPEPQPNAAGGYE